MIDIVERLRTLRAENNRLRALVQDLEAERKRLKAQIEPLRMDTLRASGEK